MLLFTCPECEVFSIGKSEDYPKFLENHTEALTEKFSFEAIVNFMNNTVRLHRYFEQVGEFTGEDLTHLLIETFSAERDKLLAEGDKIKENLKDKGE